MVRRPSDAALGRAAAVVAALLSLAYWAHNSRGGLGALSYDSFRYLAGAESLAARGAYLDLDGTPQHVWPPGTSLVYAAAARVTGRQPDMLVPAVNVVALLITLFAFWRLLEAARVRWWIAAIAFGALALDSTMLSQTTKLWSDPLALAVFVAMLCCVVEERWLPANVLALVAVTLRFAMIATIPFLLIAAFRRRRGRWLPFVSGAVAGAFVFAARGGGAAAWHAPQLREAWAAVAQLAGDLVPSALVVIGVTILVPFVVARRREAAAVALIWCGVYVAFLLLAQAVATPSFAFDTRIVFPLYPAMLLAAAVAADASDRRVVTLCIAAVMAVGALRGAHYVIGAWRAPAAQTCVTREMLVAAIRRDASRVQTPVSNAQGLVWYALRRPVRRPPAKGEPVWIDSRSACPSSIDDDVPPPPDAMVIAAR